MEQIRIRIQKCKVICLNEMGLHPITTNPKYMKATTKAKLLKLVEEKLKESDDLLDAEFNKVCLESVFSEDTDFKNYPVFVDTRFEEQVLKVKEADLQLEEFEKNKRKEADNIE